MKTQAPPVVIASLLCSMKKTLTFREITEPSELENAFRFRYEEYAKTRMSRYLSENTARIDMDVFDLHSRHYGLYYSNELVGYLRVVLDREEYFGSSAYETGLRYNIFNESSHNKEDLKKIDETDFPFLSYHYTPENVKSRFDALKCDGEQFAEASRLIIREDLRGLKTSAFLIECAMMLFMLICGNRKTAILHCCKDHSLFYKHYGFRSFHEGQEITDGGIKKEVMYLSMSSGLLPANLKVRFEQMSVEFTHTGKINRTI